ncbi:MAG: hypothetical protein AB1485_05050 [Candidatus Thermoplasmatota archaeon]
MLGILLLVLLAIFYAGSGSSAPMPAPPPYAPPKKEKISTAIIIVIVVVVILVILIPIILAYLFLYVWVSGMMPGSAPMTPTVSLGSSSVDAAKRNVTWTIIGVSRSDIRWSDITVTARKNGVTVAVTAYARIDGTEHVLPYTGTGYVTTGDTVRIDLGSSQSPGTRVDITLVYEPTGGMVGTAYTVIV